MELRSTRKRNEYKELQITLKDGMELQEMRQVLDALNQSVNERETNFFEDDDMERAIRESELDFMPSNNAGLWNSTMMGTFQATSPCSSPEAPAHIIIVQAEVHHSLNWSPECSEEERLNRKRLASTSELEHNSNDSKSMSKSFNAIEPFAKRMNQKSDFFLKHSPLSNIANEGNEETQNGNNDNNDSIQIVGPISMRGPSNDSGVNSVHGSNKSLSTTSSLDNVVENSEEDSPIATINISNSSSSFNDSPDIVGPISHRRPINDSGVAAFSENEAVASSSWDFNLANDSWIEPHNNENRFLISLSNLSHFKNTDDDYEHSEPSL
uniref:Uncharacterized protein n=1 Tax=Stomoxys calcitrans TaxID=35570 RepID=A0A1I8PS78_STOCA